MNDIKVIRGGIMMSSITSSMMVFVYIIGIIIELVDIIKYKNPVYRNVLGLFRFFSFDGNFLSFIFSIIICIRNYKVYKIPKDDEKFKDKAVSHFIYIISLISASNGIIILIIAIFLICYPISNKDWRTNFMEGYRGVALYIMIPLILFVKFLFFETRKRDLKLYEKFIGGIPISIYVLIMSLLCKSKILTSFDEKDGDGLIPYPFFDFEHYNFYFCLIMTLFLVVLGFGISFLLDFLSKKYEILSNKALEKKKEEEGINDDNQQSFLESTPQPN